MLCMRYKCHYLRPPQISDSSLKLANPNSIFVSSFPKGAFVLKVLSNRGRVSMSTSQAATAVQEVSADGAFKRTASTFRNVISEDGSSGFPAVPGRYHLYISYACPWASRCYAFLKLKGLEDVIGLTVKRFIFFVILMRCCSDDSFLIRKRERSQPTDTNTNTNTNTNTDTNTNILAFAFVSSSFKSSSSFCVQITKPIWERSREGEDHFGWPFAASEDEYPAAHPDPINGAKFIRDLYEQADPNAKKFSVPVLWDKEKKTIVNNESAEITRMFNDQFNKFAKNPSLDLYPLHLRDEIDRINGFVYESINNGVYRCGFATKQAPYDQAFDELFSALDRCEEILSKQRYIAGNVLTEADIRLFVTLIRFDEVYVVHFKCNKKLIREYSNLFNYTKDIYQVPGIAETVNMQHIKDHYYGSHPSINPHGVVPKGSNIDYNQPHDRDRFSN